MRKTIKVIKSASNNTSARRTKTVMKIDIFYLAGMSHGGKKGANPRPPSSSSSTVLSEFWCFQWSSRETCRAAVVSDGTEQQKRRRRFRRAGQRNAAIRDSDEPSDWDERLSVIRNGDGGVRSKNGKSGFGERSSPVRPPTKITTDYGALGSREWERVRRVARRRFPHKAARNTAALHQLGGTAPWWGCRTIIIVVLLRKKRRKQLFRDGSVVPES